MSPHANRGAASRYTNPAAGEIVELRQKHGLTIEQCARLALSTARSWQMWETGERRMHPAIWQWVNVQLTGIDAVLANAPTLASFTSLAAFRKALKDSGA